MRVENGVMAKELELSRNLNKTAIDRKDSELTSLSMTLQQQIDENSTLKNELRKIGGGIDKKAIATLQTELEKVRGELEEKETAIANLQTELDQAKADLDAETLKLEDKINNYRIDLLNKDEEIREKEKTISELENLIVLAAKNDESVSQVEELTTPPEEQAAVTAIPVTENTESPAVNNEPSTVDPEPITEKTVFEPEEAEPDTIKVLQTEVQPKLLNPKQLAEWINEKHHPEKPITDQNVRDWYNPKKTCEEKRLENEKKYGHRLDHKDKKGTLWFAVG